MNLIVFNGKEILKLEDCYFCIIEKNDAPAVLITEQENIIEILTPEDKTFPKMSQELYKFAKEISVN